MLKYRFTRSLVAVLVLASLICQGTWVLAGTTGSLTGMVSESGNNAAVPNAKVTATSPSQTVSTSTDAGGHFTFASLVPDTYVVSVEKQGFDSYSQSGISVFADQTQALNLRTQRALKEIGRVSARATTDIVRPGTTTDVYSVNATTADRTRALGGGGSLNQVYSAVATVPGVYVPSGSNGWYQTIQIRGGSYDQIGYEVDGVPVNRSFDFYPAHTASSLGQSEVQVYTGSAPANSESQGLSGFINQVIRTGTYPPFGGADVGIGGPAFYHQLSFETGGSTINRNFSYYVGFSAVNQDVRTLDQFNGAAYSAIYGTPFALLPCGSDPNAAACYNGGAGPPRNALGTPVAANGYALLPFNLGSIATIQDRENVVNLHFGLPHHHDAGRDDIQVLYDVGGINSYLYDSPQDQGPAVTALTGPVTFPSGFKYTGGLGKAIPSDVASLVKPNYLSTQDSIGLVPSTRRAVQQNDQAIIKLQYQKNFSSNAYFRLYGYSFYSDYLQNDPNDGSLPIGISTDYELDTHTRGISGLFADQLSSQHLLQFQSSFTTATATRANNSFAGAGSTLAYAVNASNPNAGICYSVTAAGPATPVACRESTRVTFGSAALNQTADGRPIGSALSGATCGGGPCELYALDNGFHATYNAVKPAFLAFNLSDTWKPTDRLVFNGGVRLDQFNFTGADTQSPLKQFFFNNWNATECVSTVVGSSPISKANLTNPSGAPLALGDPCSAANTANTKYVPATLFNKPVNYSFAELQPRIGATYEVNPDTVVRVNYGKFAQPGNAAFEQYNTEQNDLADFIGPLFYRYGFDQPGHHQLPEESYNLDASLEHHIKGTDLSFKLTPFYRTTKNEQATFFIDPTTGFVSGLDVGKLRSRGIEFQFTKGSFSRDGLSWLLAYTYTDAKIKYTPLPNGGSVLSPINNDISKYNQYTSFCAQNFKDARCGGLNTAPTTAVPCFTTTGAADPACAPGSIANPYFTAPVQALLDNGTYYYPSTPIIAGVNLGQNSYAIPHVAAFVLNYRKGRFAITPALQLEAGARYGSPEATNGIDPAAGCGALTGAVDRGRYPFGAAPGTSGATGAPYDATMCLGVLNAIPDPYTRRFDGIGAFEAPAQLLGNLQLSYDASKAVTFILNFTNVINQCFGGSNEPWTGLASPKVCSYTGSGAPGAAAPVGNVYNPGAFLQPAVKYPYFPFFGPYNPNTQGGNNSPFGVFLTARLKM